eukprot:gene23298-biopygen11820
MGGDSTQQRCAVVCAPWLLRSGEFTRACTPSPMAWTRKFCRWRDEGNASYGSLFEIFGSLRMCAPHAQKIQ